MKTVRLITCETSIQANIIKGRLENEGIPCFITNENFSNLMPNYNRILDSGPHIMVDQNSYQKAIELLELNVTKELICPNCQSKNIKVSLGKNWLKKSFTIIISLFCSIPFNNINHVYCCKDCNTEF